MVLGRRVATFHNIMFQMCFLDIAAHLSHRQVFLENTTHLKVTAWFL